MKKYISPGEKVELLALIGEFVFTIGLGFFADGVVEGLKDLLLVERLHAYYLRRTQGIRGVHTFPVAIKKREKIASQISGHTRIPVCDYMIIYIYIYVKCVRFRYFFFSFDLLRFNFQWFS